MSLLSQPQTSQDGPAGDIAWSVLDAANDLGDTVTIDACRRVIDANLRGARARDVGHGGRRGVLRLVPDRQARANPWSQVLDIKSLI